MNLEARIKELEDAIRKHRDWKGDDRCFMDDGELYSVLPDYKAAETQLPPKEHFLKSCERFWECRQKKEEHLWVKTPPPPEWVPVFDWTIDIDPIVESEIVGDSVKNLTQGHRVIIYKKEEKPSTSK